MVNTPDYLVWRVKCAPNDLQRVEAVARSESDPARRVVVESYTTPDGVLTATVHSSGPLSSYFDSVSVLPDDTECSFRLEFRLAGPPNPFWKDIMVRILSAVRLAAPGVIIRRVE